MYMETKKSLILYNLVQYTTNPATDSRSTSGIFLNPRPQIHPTGYLNRFHVFHVLKYDT